jgi:hypothetical protein
MPVAFQGSSCRPWIPNMQPSHSNAVLHETRNAILVKSSWNLKDIYMLLMHRRRQSGNTTLRIDVPDTNFTARVFSNETDSFNSIKICGSLDRIWILWWHLVDFDAPLCITWWILRWPLKTYQGFNGYSQGAHVCRLTLRSRILTTPALPSPQLIPILTNS